MPTFLTVKEAATLTRKSPSSIRRIIYPIIHDDKHPDRKHIRPTVEEGKKLRLDGENFAWRISEELLRRELPAESRGTHGAAAAPSRAGPSSDAELLSILRGELQIKNDQIKRQDEHMAKLTELMNTLSSGWPDHRVRPPAFR
jgi:hypothetical protein